MNARERRRAIIAVLEGPKGPVSGSALAREVGVSRQVVVQDIALLRADGHDIVATNRGYVLQEAASSPAVPTRLVKVRHSVEQAGDELYEYRRRGWRRAQRDRQPSCVRQDHGRPGHPQPPRCRALSARYRERQELSAANGDERLSLPSHCGGGRTGPSTGRAMLKEKGYLADLMPYEDDLS